MIQVEIVKNNGVYQSIQVSGHAYSGEPGFDLVCAGVSSIMTGALNAFDEMDDSVNLTLTKEPLIQIDIQTPSELNQKLIEFVHIQLKTVEYAYAQNIEIHEKEVTS